MERRQIRKLFKIIALVCLWNWSKNCQQKAELVCLPENERSYSEDCGFRNDERNGNGLSGHDPWKNARRTNARRSNPHRNDSRRIQAQDARDSHGAADPRHGCCLVFDGVFRLGLGLVILQCSAARESANQTAGAIGKQPAPRARAHLRIRSRLRAVGPAEMRKRPSARGPAHSRPTVAE